MRWPVLGPRAGEREGLPAGIVYAEAGAAGTPSIGTTAGGAPELHDLRELSVEIREQIEGARTEGSVPQILTMFNGPVTHMMLEEGSVIYDNVTANIKVTGATTAEIKQSIDDQLKTAGLENLEATFDAAGKLTIAVPQVGPSPGMGV